MKLFRTRRASTRFQHEAMAVHRIISTSLISHLMFFVRTPHVERIEPDVALTLQSGLRGELSRYRLRATVDGGIMHT